MENIECEKSKEKLKFLKETTRTKAVGLNYLFPSVCKSSISLPLTAAQIEGLISTTALFLYRSVHHPLRKMQLQTEN